MSEHHEKDRINRREALRGGIAATAATAVIAGVGASSAKAEGDPYAEPAEPALPPSDMVLDLKRAALVVTDS